MALKTRSMITDARAQDVILIAFCYLSVPDLLSVSQTCKTLWRICMAKQIWLNAWRRDVLSNILPHPTQLVPLDLLSGSQMKAAVVHALQLHRGLTCPPERRRMRKILLDQKYPITWTRIVHGSWLLVAMSDSSASILALFSVASLLGSRSQDLLAQAFLEGPVVNGFVDISDKSGITIALELRTSLATTTDVLSVRTHEGSLKFVRLASHTGISHIRALDGDLLGFALHDDVSIPSILNWRTGTVTHLRNRPDIHGGVAAMTLSGDQVAFLTPKSLHVLQISRCENGTVRNSVISVLPLDHWQGVEYADIAFHKTDAQIILRICISNDGGVYAYSISTQCLSSTLRSLRDALVWSREIESSPSIRKVMRPMFDRTRTSISWLEDTSKLSPKFPPVQFVTVEQGGTEAHSPPQALSCFTLSERDMPALYASSVRDYDQGLGLLAVGNIVGELALFSFTEDAILQLTDAIKPADAVPWNGQELLPQTACKPYPPRPFYWDLEYLTQEHRQRVLQLWEKHWPAGLEEPKGWSRTSPGFMSCVEYPFSDAIGDPAWALEAQCHYLGRPIPLLHNIDNYSVTFITVGGLFLIYRTDSESDIPFCHVMDPKLGLSDLVAMLPETLNIITPLERGVVHTFDCAGSLTEETESIVAYQIWEVRHGLNRWKRLKERGGQVPKGWDTVVPPLPPTRDNVLCSEQCDVCDRIKSLYYGKNAQ